ncbi:MAG: hypothetical protein O3B31_15090 [Chloroflexi bacterium]|nr:hypothetical protein [Chloroflexota bacterium]MDA1004648.1 hypothetical protein [Chloroflexota bacterium]
MTTFATIRDQLPELTAGGQPLLTVSLDLDPGADGIPAAPRVLAQAWRHVEEQTPVAHDTRRSIEEDQAAVESAIAGAIAGGARGYLYIGSAAAGIRFELETPQPFRNAATLLRVPWLFEVVRYDYLSRRSVSLVMTTIDEMHAFRVHYGDVVERTDIEHDASAVSSTHGRTNRQSGVAAAPGGGLAGGHGWGRIEKSVLAHRARFAADEAARLTDFIGDDDIVLIAGADQPRAELLQHLPASTVERATLLPHVAPTASEQELADQAMALAREAQLVAADREVEGWLTGDHRDRAVSGIGALRAASDEGRLGRLILHEQAVTHFGTADDARVHPGAVGDDEAVNDLLRSALTHGVECAITRSDAVLERYEGAVGVARW